MTRALILDNLEKTPEVYLKKEAADYWPERPSGQGETR
jgi:hypothetical protein